MKGSDDQVFKHELKTMILRVCDKPEWTPAELSDGEALFGDDTRLELDSLDGLQISMAIQKEFGVRIGDPKEMRRILQSVNSLADHLRPGEGQ